MHPVMLIQNVFCPKLSIPGQLAFVVLASLLEMSVLVVVHVLFVTKYQTRHMQTAVLWKLYRVKNQGET